MGIPAFEKPMLASSAILSRTRPLMLPSAEWRTFPAVLLEAQFPQTLKKSHTPSRRNLRNDIGIISSAYGRSPGLGEEQLLSSSVAHPPTKRICETAVRASLQPSSRSSKLNELSPPPSRTISVMSSSSFGKENGRCKRHRAIERNWADPHKVSPVARC